jgi:hypothetical protein
MFPKSWRWLALLAGNVVMVCMLGLYQPPSAAPREDQPFANAVEQRLEMIRLLRETNALLKEQNELLRSGKLRVTVEPAK